MKLTPDHFQRRAREHHNRLTELYSLIDQKVERERIQEAAKVAKAELRTDKDWGRSSARRDTLSTEEETALSAIWSAECHLSFPTNSNPEKSQWQSHIYDALIDLSEYGGE